LLKKTQLKSCSVQCECSARAGEYSPYAACVTGLENKAQITDANLSQLGSEIDIPADTLILAIGQRPDLLFLDKSKLSVTDRGRIAVKDEAGTTVVEHIYAGGDAVRGPATIIEAVADGQRAARAICGKLGVDYRHLEAQHPVLSNKDVLDVKRARARKVRQIHPSVLSSSERRGFDLVEGVFTQEEARAEASRCLQCSTICDKCVDVCPNRANYSYKITPFEMSLPVVRCVSGGMEVVRQELFSLRQERQILHVDDFCNKCGVCETFCVHSGNPERDKPRLFFDEGDFQQEENNAFHVSKTSIRSRNHGHESRLAIEGDSLQYEDEWLTIGFSSALDIQEMALKKRFAGERPLKHIGPMVAVLRGVRDTLPFLAEISEGPDKEDGKWGR